MFKYHSFRFSNYGSFMPCDITADVYRNRKAGDMGGVFLNIEAERRGFPAEALRADPRFIDRAEHILLEPGINRVGVWLVDGPADGLFGEQGAVFKIAADANADDHGRAGVAPGLPDDVHHRLDQVFARGGGGEHLQLAHVFAAEAFGRHRDFYRIARHQAGMDDGRRIIPAVDPFERVGNHRAPQEPFGIAAPNAFVYSIFTRASRDNGLLADLRKHHRHAGILADGDIELLRRRVIADHIA